MALTQISSNGVKDDSIVNADIKSDAAIALSKLASTPAVLTGSTNNQITTVTSANAIQGEANLTFDGTTLGVTGNLVLGNTTQSKILHNTSDASDNKWLSINGGGDASQSRGGGITFFGNEVTDNQGRINIAAGNSGDTSGYINFNTAGSERLRVKTDGDVEITDGDLVIGTSGHGIDFSATGGPTNGSGTSELLSDYEEGTWTPGVSSGTITGGGFYTRVGNIVHVQMYDSSLGGTRGSEGFALTGLPFVPEKWTPGSMYAFDYNAEGTQQATVAVKQDNAEFRVVEWGNEAIGTDFENGYFVAQCTYRIT